MTDLDQLATETGFTVTLTMPRGWTKLTARGPGTVRVVAVENRHHSDPLGVAREGMVRALLEEHYGVTMPEASAS